MNTTPSAFQADASCSEHELTHLENELLNSPQTSRRIKRYLSPSVPAAARFSSLN